MTAQPTYTTKPVYTQNETLARVIKQSGTKRLQSKEVFAPSVARMIAAELNQDETSMAHVKFHPVMDSLPTWTATIDMGTFTTEVCTVARTAHQAKQSILRHMGSRTNILQVVKA